MQLQYSLDKFYDQNNQLILFINALALLPTTFLLSPLLKLRMMNNK